MPIWPIAVFAILIVLFFSLGLYAPVFEPPYLVLILNTLFLTISSLVVAAISVQTYLVGGRSNVLLLGCAFLINGIAAAVAGWLFSFSANLTVTIYNTCTLLSAFLQLANAVFPPQVLGVEPMRKDLRARLVVFFVASIAIIALVIAFAYYNVLPEFFVEGSGATMLDISVLAVTILFFAASSLLLFTRWLKSKSSFLLWYSMGLALFAIGLFGVSLEKSLGDPIGWAGKIAQYVGGLYFIVAVYKVVRTPTGETLPEKWAEGFARDTEQLDKLFSGMLNGFSYQQIILEDGKPVDYVFLAVNDAFEKQTGLRMRDIVGKRVTEVLPGIEKDPADWIGVYGKVALTGQPVTFENYAQPLGRWYSVSAYSPRKGYFVAIFEDITNRKKAEEDLKLVEQRLELVTDNSRDGINLLDLKTGKYIYMNPAQVALTGFTKEEINNISQQEAQERTHPDDRSITIDQQKKVANGEDMPEAVEYRWKVKSGEYRWFSDSRKLVRNEKGQPIALVGISRDVTERKQIEEDLKKSQAEISALFENIPAGLVLFEAKSPYKVLAHNKFYQMLFDEPFKSQGMIGLNIYEYAPEVEASGVKTVFDEVVKTRRPKSFLEFPYKSNPPKQIWFNWYMAPVILDDEVVALASMSLDVTDRHEAQEALEEAKTKLEGYAKNLEQLVEERTKQLKDSERLAAIGATAGMVGHDIRNPLQAITSDVYLAKSDLSDIPGGTAKEGIIESLEEIQKNVEYINKIVQDLQDYARPLAPSPKETDLEKVFDEVLPKKAIPTNVKVFRKIEPGAMKTTVDPDMFKRILANLVNNAVQAMPDGGKLVMKAVALNENLVITVGDTGVGIPEEARPRLFTPLFTTKSRGQGFGLAVVKRMTEAMGGTVSFETEIGKGTTFAIKLPLKKPNREKSNA